MKSEFSTPLADVLTEGKAEHVRRLRSRLPSPDDADDVWQDASVKALRHAATLAGVESPKAWMSVVLRRLVVDRYRRAARERRRAEALAAQPEPASEAGAREQEEISTPLACMSGLVRQLRPDYGDIIGLTYLQERSVKAAADHLGVTATNAGVRLHRARGALRAAMAAKCEACPLQECWSKARLDSLAPEARIAPGPREG